MRGMMANGTGVATVKVRVQPNASRNEVVGFMRDELRVRVRAAPEGGRANQAVVELLADKLGIVTARVIIIRGHRSRQKVINIEGLEAEEVTRRLAGE